MKKSLSPSAKRNKRLTNARNAAAAGRRAAMTRANSLRQQVYLAALFNSLKRPTINNPRRK
jgi:hypothetical protein